MPPEAIKFVKEDCRNKAFLMVSNIPIYIGLAGYHHHHIMLVIIYRERDLHRYRYRRIYHTSLIYIYLKTNICLAMYIFC